jgi:hypothetical protein
MAETCWRTPSNLTTSKYYCAFFGINVVFILINARNMDHLKQEQQVWAFPITHGSSTVSQLSLFTCGGILYPHIPMQVKSYLVY